jgi:hypothetical protein
MCGQEHPLLLITSCISLEGHANSTHLLEVLFPRKVDERRLYDLAQKRLKDHASLGAGGGKRAPTNAVKTQVRTWRMTRSRSWYTIAPSYVVGDAEALIPISARTCYTRDESGLPQRDTRAGATQAGTSLKGTNYFVNILIISPYLYVLYKQTWQKKLIPIPIEGVSQA